MIRKIATIGYFDGVHRGHQFLFQQVRETAGARGMAPVIYTFYEHPKEVLTGSCPPLLTPGEERFERLEREGEVRCLHFQEVQHLTAEAFMRRIHEEGVRALLMGYDHHFGSDRIEDYETYARIGGKVGIEVLRAEELHDAKVGHVSSSQVRRCLLAGDVAQANRMLGYAYSIRGQVVHGNAIGRTLGFPTANLHYPAQKLLPSVGVYAGRCKVESTEYPVLVNIGNNPTVGNSRLSIEGFLVGYDGCLYAMPLQFELERFLREEKKFGSLEELRGQLEEDIKEVL